MENFLNDLQEIWNKDKGNSLSVYLKNHKEVDEYFSKMLEQEPWFESKRKLFACLVKGITKPTFCKQCGKKLSVDFARENKQYCSHKCAGNSIERLEKVKKTTLDRYGVKNAFQSKEIQEKQKKTCIEKYGVENAFQSEEIKEKSKQTCLKRYGTEFAGQSEEIKEKIKRVNLGRYGFEHASQNEDVKNKMKETNLERYGVIAPAQNEQVIEKMKQTCLERYGVDCSLKDVEIDKKRKDTWFLEYYNYIQEKWKEYVIPLFSKEEYKGQNKEYKWKCVKCGNEFKSDLRISRQLIDGLGYMPRCLNCYPIISGTSLKEKEVLEFIKSIYSGEIIENDRKILNGKELDIYIPSKNLAIEFDGLFYHNEVSKGKNYHLNKTEECEKQNIQLIHIFEDEWINKQEIVKDRLKSLLGVFDKKVYARKCEIREIDRKTCNNFLNENHLQGSDNSSIRLGLFFENELVSLMTFGKPRFNKKYDFELIRFSSKLGYQVIGGFGKLLKFFIRKHSNSSIISYADRRYSKGNVYLKGDFKFLEKSKPNYFYVKGLEKYSRYQCQKHKLSKILGDKFDVNLSETENMILNGFYKIYDCGNLVYEYNPLLSK